MLQLDFTEPEASMWENETISILKYNDSRISIYHTFNSLTLYNPIIFSSNVINAWIKLSDESICRVYIQFSLIKIYHQQGAMNLLL